MKIIIASDSFKGSFSTFEVADTIEKGIRKVNKEATIIKIPVADGGEGTVDALVLGTGGRYEDVEVIGPLGTRTKAKIGILKDDVAVIEMASASGLPLLKRSELNPLITTTFGTGQLITAALDLGCRKILIGLGGSATNDGGVGMAQALGVSFKNRLGEEIGFGGSELIHIDDIDISNLDRRIYKTEIIIMSDVTNPLCGENGASYIYGPQKGATDETIKLLDNNLNHYASVLKDKLGKDVKNMEGAGAAGGLGAGILAFCNGIMSPGIDKVLEVSGLNEHLNDADLVITGEGRIDYQTLYGKVAVGVGKRSLSKNVPVVAIVGSIGEGASEVYSQGINAIFDIVDKPMSLTDAMENVSSLLEQAAENVMRLINIGCLSGHTRRSVNKDKETFSYENSGS
ncbi:glycerate kinase [Bacillus infantis]|uniref:glycerate kinase family protein n=1 Tax=Bacillus infantis TaxID=324767 RepID=UPI0020035845|nr:glycerate kinase [Bacillus infantis]MCK6207060.1 glycerate kinase [Bacillus infantis]